ncbi:tyrosine-type recombinase/integrase [Pseudomonas fluorescens]|uniref:Prophage integrase IntS n=1 Tax=Pseudomonas fluorescens TaxID=294 RepID=A0A5E7EVS6_PSEFL|nr:integrase arm-type DNA-binding domain-containing protein [Pseudomonas fluorescens]VVO30896.1 Prophage integrase IntS [Pseudomonas fluorescens]
MTGLSTVKVKSLIKAGSAGMTGDGKGLYLQISKTGGASWIYRYKIEGKSRYMGLGPFPTIGLAEAREMAEDARRGVTRGIDPLEAREADRESKRKAASANEARKITFMTAAEGYRERQGAGWSEKWHRGWWRKLELYAFPVIGEMPVAEVDTAMVLKILTPIWLTKTRTADEVRGQIEQVLDAAKALGWRAGENPARWRGHLANLLSRSDKKKAREREHYAAMNWRDVPFLISKLAAIPTRDAYAARVLILTGARSKMVRFAKWNEVDLEAKVWSLSASRMKMKAAFQIPLADEVITLLKELSQVATTDYIFPGQGKTGVMHANGIRNLLHGLGHEDITRHGFRSSFRDWAAESTNFPREICEMALAHDERSETESAYNRTDFFVKRGKLMRAWAKFAVSKTHRAADNSLPEEMA